MKLLERELRGHLILVFMDLEGTQFSHEMIEIGAYKVYLKKDLTVKKIMPGFKSYVRPKSKVGSVVTNLTGITDELVKREGKPFRVVQQDFKKYVGKDWNRCLFVTFGSHDCRIIMQSAANNLDASDEDAKFIVSHDWDFANWLAKFIRDPNGNTYSLANYLKLFGVDFKGKAHDALADAYNLIDLYQAILAKKDIFQTQYKRTLGLKNNHFPEPVRRLLVDLSEGREINSDVFSSYVEEYLS